MNLSNKMNIISKEYFESSSGLILENDNIY